MAMVRDPEDDKTSRRWRWMLLAVVGGLPIVAIIMFIATFDAEVFKPQIVAAVKQATGRDLVIQGRLHLAFSLRPTIAADKVSFANAPGGSRAEMVTLERIEAQIALMPLLQHQLSIDSLSLVRPDVLLETDAQGRGNWRFAEAAPPSPVAGGGTGRTPQAGGSRNSFFVRSVRIDDGTLTWRDGRTGAVTTVGLRQGEFQTESATAPISVATDATWNGTAFTTSGQIGSLNGLQGQSAAPWPLRLILSSGDAKLNVSGVIATPLQGKGYQLKLEGTAASLAALAPLLPGRKLPPLRDVSIAAEVTDTGAPMPDITGLALRAGQSDLGTMAPGLKLGRLEIVVPRMDQPVRVTAEGTLDGNALAVLASVGAPAALLSGGRPAAPVPVDMALSAAEARITVKGNIADPANLAGADLALRAGVPDLAGLGRLAGLALPAMKDVNLQARLLSPAGGFSRGVVLRELTFTQPSIDLAGELSVTLAPRVAVQGNLASKRIDMDALSALVAAGNGAAAPAAAATPAPTAGQGQRGQRGGRDNARRVIPDTPLPFAVLRSADADLQMRVDELIRSGETTRNLSFRLALKDGRLKLDPFTADVPAGRLSGSLTVDATQAEPAVALVLRSPGLDIRKLYQAIGREGDASGSVELDLDLRGQGQNPQAIAATADGHLGMAVVGGSVENSVLSLGLLGEVLRGVNQGEILARRGSTQVRCFALRVDARGGNGDVRALLVDSSTLLLDGGGGLSLRDETLALRMRAQPRLLGIGLVLPLRVGGSFANPRTSLDPLGSVGAAGQTVTGTAGTAVGVVGSGLGAVTGALGIGNGGNVLPTSDACGTQLAIARGGRTGAAPAAVPGQEQAPASGQRGQGNRQRQGPLQRLLPR